MRQATHEYGQEAPTDANNLFYVHWVNFNKRLDQWVPGALVVLTRELEWPRPKAPAPVKKEPSLLKKATKTAKQAKAAKRAAARTESPVPSPTTLKRKASALNDSQDTEMDDGDSEGDSEEDADGESFIETPQGPPTPGPDSSSKEQEIEKLRHGGSMSQSAHEISRVKNLSKLQIGKHQVEAWYFSPYPVEYAHAPVLYICEFCLSYFKSEKMFSRHHSRCTLLHPPGNEIYRHEDISFFEIDGRRQLTWCRNLSLLSKCFLDQ